MANIEMKFRRRTSGVLAISAAIAVVLLFAFPIVPYNLSLQIPFVYEGPPVCTGQTVGGVPVCYLTHHYPATNVTGRASVSYALFGIGIQPFNGSYRIVEGNNSAIFYTTDAKITGAEYFPFPAFDLNPRGEVAIQNVSVARDALGLVNFSATIKNTGTRTLAPVLASFDYPGDYNNRTQGGIVWDDYMTGGRCAMTLAPGSSCSVWNEAFNDNDSLTAGQSLSYRVEVTTSYDGDIYTDPIIYQQSFQGLWPASGLTSDWVNAFIQEVNANRTGPKLVEDQTLDAFAQTRFNTQVANYNVSNYGFQQDFARSFPGSSLQIGETTLWPGTQLPFEYASTLQESAPGHWSVLTNPNFTHFGYYIGYGLSIVVSQPCSITEFPGGQNIPALLTSHGCQFHYEQAVWLVIEVGS